MRDAVRSGAPGFRCLLTICPDHNPLGPLDMVGTYDERSDRVQLLAEAIDRATPTRTASSSSRWWARPTPTI